MIERDVIFDEFGSSVALWCGADLDAGGLARATEFVVERNVPAISVASDVIGVVWPWLENKDVKIVSRFYFPDKKITDEQISDITMQINAAFKHGAGGAQVFLPYAGLKDLVAQTHVIRDDLFFNRDLSIGIDMADIDSCDWDDLFQNLQKINASALVLVLTKDTGKKSDFVGRIYGMLNAWNNANKFDLHFAFGPNFMRIEQVVRLIESMRPDLLKGVKFWVNF